MVSSNVARSLSIMRRAHTKRQLTCLGMVTSELGSSRGWRTLQTIKGGFRAKSALLDAGIALQQKMVVPGNFKYEGSQIAIHELLNATHRLPRFLQRTMRWQ